MFRHCSDALPDTISFISLISVMIAISINNYSNFAKVVLFITLYAFNIILI